MRKYLLILLACQILATSLPGNQGVQALFKIGAFLHHFVHHVVCLQEEIGIVDFVKLHYADHHHLDTDYYAHDKLPFQSGHHQEHPPIGQQMHYLVEAHYSFKLLQGLECDANQFIAYSEPWRSSRHTGDVWHPPRV